MSSYAEVEMLVVQWGEARGIVQNGTPMGQAIKTIEEATELLKGLNKNSITEVRDALGDIWVTMVMVAAITDLNLVECFYGAYDEIKDRKGHMGKDGIFYREPK
jgi:hypothetical protein